MATPEFKPKMRNGSKGNSRIRSALNVAAQVIAGLGSATQGGGPSKRKAPGGPTKRKRARKISLKGGATQSYVATQAKRKSKTKVSLSTPGCSQTVNQTIKMGSGKYVKCNMRHTHTYQQVSVSGLGLQNALTLNTILGKLSNNVTAPGILTRTDKNDIGTDLFEFVPLYSNTGVATIYGSDPSTTQRKINLQSVRSELSVTNHCTLNVHVDVYWCAPVKNQGLDPVVSWSTALALVNGGQTNQITPPTTATLTSTSGAIADPIIYGMTPQMCSMFKKYWSIKRVNSLNLNPGAIVDIHTRIIYNKKISEQVQSDSTSEYITNQTLIPMVVIRAQPVISVTGASAQTSYGSAQVGFIHRQVINFAVAKEKDLEINRINNTLTFSAGVQRIIDEDGDATTAVNA